MSLLTIDQNNYKFDTINSPRSKKALQNLGLIEKDLYYLTREQIEKQGVDQQFQDDHDFFIQTKYHHLRQRCNQFLQMAKQEREKIIQEEKVEEISHNQSSETGNSRSSFRVSRLAQKKDEILKQLRQKQQIEIEKQIKDEIKIEEMHQKNLLKEQKLQQLKEQQLQEQQVKQQELEIKMKQIEKKIEAARRKQQEENEKIVLKQIEDEEHLLRKKQEYEIQKQKKKEEQERTRIIKLASLEKRIELQEQQKQQDNTQRQFEYERKLQNIKIDAEKKQKEMKLRNKQSEEQIHLRLEQARGQQAEEIKRVEEKMINTENQNFERRKQREIDRENYNQQKREKEQLKYQILIDKKSSLEREKELKDDIYIKNELEREFRKKEQDSIINRQRTLVTQHKDRKREEVKINSIKQSQSLELKRQEFITKKEEIISQAEQGRQQRILAAKRNQINQVLKLEDADLNNMRLKRLEELRNKKMIEKIEEVDVRLKTFQDEQNRITKLKLKLEKQLQKEKEQILNDFQKRKAEFILNRTIKNQNQNQSLSSIQVSHQSFPTQYIKQINTAQNPEFYKPQNKFPNSQLEFPTNRTAQIQYNNSLSPRNIIIQKTESDIQPLVKYTNKFTPDIKITPQSNILMTTSTTKNIPLYLSIEQKKNELKKQRMINSQSMKAQRKPSYEVDAKTYMAVQLYQSPNFPQFHVDVKLKQKSKSKKKLQTKSNLKN